MSNIVKPDSAKVIESLVLNGDISKLNSMEKVKYYNSFCESLKLNPLTQPFQIIRFQGKEVLYATKTATEQLRQSHQVSIERLEKEFSHELYIVTAYVRNGQGRTDASTGAVNIANLKGEALSNAIMKAETKAKRRATLSICGLGILDESEVDSIGSHTITPISSLSQSQPEPKQDRNYTEEADLITDLETLGKWWSSIPIKEKKGLESLKNLHKERLLKEEAEKQAEQTPETSELEF